MTEYTTIKFEGDHVKAELRVHKSMDWARQFWPEVVKACDANSCYRVLGVSESLSVMPFFDGFDFVGLFRDLGIDTKYRIAWVELNPEALETVSFVDNAMYNRGLPGRLFPTEAEAKKWLLGEEGF